MTLKTAALIACPALAAVAAWLIFYASKANQPRNQFREHAQSRQGYPYGEDET